MFISAKAFFEDNTKNNERLLIRMNDTIPILFISLYKKNAAGLTPVKSGALIRSIITQAMGNTANISWRSPYAAAQNAGGHTVPRMVKGPNKRDGGFGIIMPGSYTYSNGAKGFAFKAFQETQKQMPAALREQGFTK